MPDAVNHAAAGPYVLYRYSTMAELSNMATPVLGSCGVHMPGHLAHHASRNNLCTVKLHT